MATTTSQRLNLWSSPRNISTALMYSFAQRADTTVIDEPLYAHYLTHQPTAAEHPGRAAVLASQDNNGARVVKHLLKHDFGTPLVVFKQMTHHLIGLNDALLDNADNVLLIREPREILASFNKVVDEVTARDIGIPQQLDLFDKISAKKTSPIVVDARKLLEDPHAVLTRLCARLKIPFVPAMLTWPAGPKPYDGIWAQHWYAGVHQSTGFLPYRPKPIDLSPTLQKIVKDCTPTYQHLLSYAL